LPIACARFMPVFDWGRRYDRDALGNDLSPR
jgi:SulP family sulfate permease